MCYPLIPPNPQISPKSTHATKSKENQNSKEKKIPNPPNETKQIISTYSPYKTQTSFSAAEIPKIPFPCIHARTPRTLHLRLSLPNCSPSCSAQDRRGIWPYGAPLIVFVVVVRRNGTFCVWKAQCSGIKLVFYFYFSLNTFGRGNLLFFLSVVYYFFFPCFIH